MLEIVQHDIMVASRELGLSKKEVGELSEPHEVVYYKDPDGEAFCAVIAIMGLIGKGGMRAEAITDVDMTEALALAQDSALLLALGMDLKGALTGVGFRGAKAEVLTTPDIMANGSRFDELFAKFITHLVQQKKVGPDIYVPATDMNTYGHHMNAAAHIYQQTYPNDPRWPASFTGKQEELALEGRAEGTGWGMVFAAEYTYDTLGISPKGKTFVMQGSGKVGEPAAIEAVDYLGMHMLGISDATKAVKALHGKRPLRLGTDVVLHKGEIVSYDPAVAQRIPRDDLLYEPVDALMLAAGSNVFTEQKGNAGKVRAKMVVEGANFAADPQARAEWETAGIIYLPGIGANSSGMRASEYEYIQGMTGVPWSREKVYHNLRDEMRMTMGEVFVEANGREHELGRAAMRVAVQRLNHRVQTGHIMRPHLPVVA